MLISTGLVAQELNCSVQVLSPNIQNTNKQVFKTLEKAIYEFMNNTPWTNEKYGPEERIECAIVINVTDQLSIDEFKGTIQVQSSRPIYRSSYDSPVFNYLDKDFNFKYLEYDRLDFNPNGYTSNLTSVLAYYAYVIIGLDHETFSLNGGEPYFLKAQTVVSNAQGDGHMGWKSVDGRRNRFWLIDNLQNPAFGKLRECLYNYHRLGLDLMYDQSNEAKAKKTITAALQGLKTVHQKRPRSFLMSLFFDAKADEIVSIFSGGQTRTTSALITTLSQVDPTNSSRWKKMQ